MSNANLIELKSCMYSNCKWCQNNCKGVNFPERHPPQKICRYTYLSTLFILHGIVDLLRTFPDIHKSGWSYVMWSCVYILCCVITGPRTELHTRADDFLYIKQRFEMRGDGAATCEQSKCVSGSGISDICCERRAVEFCGAKDNKQH